MLAPVGDHRHLAGQVQVQRELAVVLAVVDVPLFLEVRYKWSGIWVRVEIETLVVVILTHVMCLLPMVVCWCSQSEVARPGT